MSNPFTSEEMEHITSSMVVFNVTTELPCVLVDDQGKVLHSQGGSRNYCNKIQNLVGDENICEIAHYQSSQQAHMLGEAYISYCPVGLVHYSVAISIGEVFKGAIIAGPIHMSEPDAYEVDQVMNQYQIPSNEKVF